MSDRKSPAYGTFETTRWSLIGCCAGSASVNADSARHALSQLCHIYWRPVFAFIRRKGLSPAAAQDLTQDFFLHVLQSDVLGRANAGRGRFRSFLLKALQNFLIDTYSKTRAQKRGGSTEFFSWNPWMIDTDMAMKLPRRAFESWEPEILFDIRWATTIVERGLRRLGQECEARGRRHLFEALSVYLAAERGEISYAEISKTLHLPPDVIKSLIHRMRHRYREILREEVALTVEKDADVEFELRYLCTVLSAASE